MKSLGFMLRIETDPLTCGLLPLYDQQHNKRGDLVNRWVAPVTAIPNATRTNNPQPLLGCDTAAFVLGLPKSTNEESSAAAAKQADIARAKRHAFNDLLSTWVVESGDPDGEVYLEWVRCGSPGLETAIARLDDRWRKRLDVDAIAIEVGAGEVFHDKRSLQAAWAAHSLQSGSGRRDTCLSCGAFGPVVDTLPQAIQGRFVPGTATAQVVLISGNFPSAQRGATGSGLQSAPVCPTCAVTAVQAFNDLASRDDHRWGSTEDTTATIWWAKSGQEYDFAAIDAPEPERVARLRRSLFDLKRSSRTIEHDRFYALTYSGNVARLMLRSWLDVPLHDVESNVNQWFVDVATASTRWPLPPLSALARSAGSIVFSRGQLREDPPHGAFDALLRTALMGLAVPPSLLNQALTRAKAEIHYATQTHPRSGPHSPFTCLICRSRERAAHRLGLFRLILNRTKPKEQPLSQYLDPSRDDPAYLAGRLFAVRERLQFLASGEVNASIVDRFFDRASSSPSAVEHSLSTLAQQHLKALERKKMKGAATNISKVLTELHARMGAAPDRLDASNQALWIAGYYQQRHGDFEKAELASNAQSSQSEEIDNS
jgi:CRISPR-associated protein Csd1